MCPGGSRIVGAKETRTVAVAEVTWPQGKVYIEVDEEEDIMDENISIFLGGGSTIPLRC